jgi:transposase
VLFQDESHLLWGDLCGYIWGPKSERIEVPIVNERQKQTYYGALDLAGHRCLIHPYDAGNSKNTIAFVEYLREQYPLCRLALVWDGASYHRSQMLQDYLETVNQGLEEKDWPVTCLRFAPNDPSQNPMEDVWLRGKRFLRRCHYLCQSLSDMTCLFELELHRQVIDFSKLFMYGHFSLIT